MPKRTSNYSSWQLEKLTNPETAAAYLSAAISDSPEMFRNALRNVAQARQMARVARDAGVTRESLYRATSEIGNPTLDTLHSVLSALGIKIQLVANTDVSHSLPTAGVPSSPTPTDASEAVELGPSIQGSGASAGYLLIGAGASYRRDLLIEGWEQGTATARPPLNHWNSASPLAVNYDLLLNAETANPVDEILAGFSAELQNTAI